MALPEFSSYPLGASVTMLIAAALPVARMGIHSLAVLLVHGGSLAILYRLR